MKPVVSEGAYFVDSLRTKRVAAISGTPRTRLSAKARERHQIYCYLLFALLEAHWNPFKFGVAGRYPWLQGQRTRRDKYLGHNIACLAVDERGAIRDFDFNHNEIFNSSLEHAEARLIRRLFTLTHHGEAPLDALEAIKLARPRSQKAFLSVLRAFERLAEGDPDLAEALGEQIDRTRSHFGTALQKFTLYTSLESCAQCAGMMALGSVKQVVYLQPDPGQNHIGAILFNLNGPGTAFAAPRPIPARDLAVVEFGALERAYLRYIRSLSSPHIRPFYVHGDDRRRASEAITTFLCTPEAKRIISDAAAKFRTFDLRFPDWQPADNAMSNAAVLRECRLFKRSAVAFGRRGTPHGR